MSASKDMHRICGQTKSQAFIFTADSYHIFLADAAMSGVEFEENIYYEQSENRKWKYNSNYSLDFKLPACISLLFTQ